MPIVAHHLGVIIGLAIFFWFISGYLRKYIKRIEDFYVMGRTDKWYLVAGTMAATWISAGTYLSLAGLSTVWGGWPPMIYYTGTYLGILLMTLCFGINLRRSKYLTIPDFFEHRFRDRTLRFLGTIALFLAVLFYLSGQVGAGGIMISQAAGIPVTAGILAFCIMILVAVALSGMWSVVWTDLISLAVMAVTAILLLPLTLAALGGFEAAFPKVFELRPLAFTSWGNVIRDSGWWIGTAFVWFPIIASSPHLLSRALIAKDEKQLILGGLVGITVINISILVLYLSFGLMGAYFTPELIKAEGLKTDAIPMVAMARLFPAAFGAFFVLGIFNATWSTADTQTAICAYNIGRDFPLAINPKFSERAQMRLTYLGIIVTILITGIISASWPGAVIHLMSLAGIVLALGWFPLLVYGMFWPRVTAKAAKITFIVGIPLSIIMVVTHIMWKWFAPYPSFYATAIGFGLPPLISAFTRPTSQEIDAYSEFKKAIEKPAEPYTFTKNDRILLAIIIAINIVFIISMLSAILRYMPK